MYTSFVYKHHCKLYAHLLIIFTFSFLTGTTKVNNLAKNIGSSAVKLTEWDLKEISDAIPIEEVGGGREYEVFSKYTWMFANTPQKK